jgi:hypothetical protein
MNQTPEITYRYHAFGMEISSQLNIPEFMESKTDKTPDIFITIGTTPNELKDVLFTGVRFQVGKGTFLLKVDRVARYYVWNGKEIVVSPEANANEGDIRLFLLGSAFGALFHQRGVFPLHGSAIVYKNKAIAFSGISGSGKSSLAASFFKRGYTVITDDISMIALSESGKPMIYPSYPQMKLWSDTLEKIGTDTNDLPKIRSGIQKYALSVHENFSSEPLELQSIYIIFSKNASGISIEPVKGLEKFNLIKNNTYRINFLKGNESSNLHFNNLNAIAGNCRVRKIERPSGGSTLEELVQLIENDLTNI